ncbi:MAG: hypothetical protein U1E70_14820 [Acetobacteraceae bacterium]
MLIPRWQISLGLCGVLVGGCQANQLYVASNTVVGVHAAVNTAQTSGSLQIGYDRQFATVIPRSVTDDPTVPGNGLPLGSSGKEVMSLAGCSNLQVDGIFLSRFIENLATGRAAKNYATALQSTNTAQAQKAIDFITCPASTTP